MNPAISTSDIAGIARKFKTSPAIPTRLEDRRRDRCEGKFRGQRRAEQRERWMPDRAFNPGCARGTWLDP